MGDLSMELKTKIVEILVKNRAERTGSQGNDIEWLYREMVQTGYQGTEEEFYEEFNREFEPILGREEMTDNEVNQITGGTGEKGKKLRSAALAGLVVMGGYTGGAGTAEANEPVRCAGTTQNDAINLNRTAKNKAKWLYGKLTDLLNQGDIENIIKLVLTAVGLGVLAGIMLKAIRNSGKPQETVETTKQGIEAILNDNGNAEEKRRALLEAIITCLEKLISFLPDDNRATLQNALETFETKWGIGNNRKLSDQGLKIPGTVEDLKADILCITVTMGNNSTEVGGACAELSRFLSVGENFSKIATVLNPGHVQPIEEEKPNEEQKKEQKKEQ